MLYSLIRKAIFSLDAENAHDLTIKLLKIVGNSPLNPLIKSVLACPHGSEKTVMGIKFKNPIGLAAGADKNGEAINGFGAMGFGFIEVGTVTPLAQDGNPKPRQFRLIEAEGIINRNGFNNYGIDYLIENVKKAQYDGVIGINIGKNKITPIEKGKDDYIYCMNKAYNYANYITVNIPEFSLRFFNKDSLLFQTKVVVGTGETPTPIFTDTLKYVEFRPTWTVPQSIIRNEMIPQMAKENNSKKYANRGYKLYENGKEIDPTDIDWTDNDNVRKRVFYFVEAPSERNSLGLVKFILTNDMSIYLHDTPSKKLFSREERTFSHGCIRVQNPDEFANQLLKNQGDWNYEKVYEAMNTGKNQNRIRLKTKYMIDIIYLTTWVDDKNKLIIGSDPYSFDNEQLKQLERFF